jgi:hypothetical protein
MTPLTRYLNSGCCDDDEHMPERRNADFKQKMMAELLRDTATNRPTAECQTAGSRGSPG